MCTSSKKKKSKIWCQTQEVTDGLSPAQEEVQVELTIIENIALDLKDI